MIKFQRPKNLNGTELREELRKVGIEISDDFNAVSLDSNGDFWLDISANDEVKANEIVAKHNGTIIPPEPTIQDKLAIVGLSVSDLKSALGLE